MIAVNVMHIGILESTQFAWLGIGSIRFLDDLAFVAPIPSIDNWIDAAFSTHTISDCPSTSTPLLFPNQGAATRAGSKTGISLPHITATTDTNLYCIVISLHVYIIAETLPKRKWN